MGFTTALVFQETGGLEIITPYTNAMKAFMTVCAVLASGGANSVVNLHPAFTLTYPHGSLRPSLMSPYSSLGPWVNGPVMPRGHFIKREAESPYHIKTKVVNAKTGTDQE